MDIIFNALFKIDIQDAAASQIILPAGENDLKSFIVELLDKIIDNPDKKGFEFESDTAEISSLINDIVAVTNSDYAMYSALSLSIANRLHRKEIESDQRNNLNVELLKGIAVISLVKFDTGLHMEIMMNETTLFRRKLTHCFGAN